MKVTLVRFNVSTQKSTKEYLCTDFTWVQLFTTDWANGDRTRMKTFSSFEAAYAYLNKVHAGGWLSDEDYELAWQLVLDCNATNLAARHGSPVDVRRIAWESIPYDWKNIDVPDQPEYEDTDLQQLTLKWAMLSKSTLED